MSVNPGFGGQKFMPEVLDKVKKLKDIKSKNNMNFDIEIDGGINFDNCQSAIEAGPQILDLHSLLKLSLFYQGSW